MINDKKAYPIFHKGKTVGYLNAALVERNNLSTDAVDTLLTLHSDLHDVYDEMEATDDPAELRMLFRLTTEIEHRQQKCWGFPQNKNFHNWFRVPKCSCPKMYNEERKGTDYGIFDPDCIVHGETTIVLSRESYKVVTDLLGDPPKANQALIEAALVRKLVLGM